MAAQRAIYKRANRGAFGFPTHKRGSFGERKRRNVQRRRHGLRAIGTRRSGFATWSWLLCLLDSRRGEFPRDREIGIRLLRAEGTRLDASRQDVSQRGIAVRDSFHYRLDRLADALPSSFGS